MSDGILALSGFQAGLESVRGTPVAATRKQPMNGWLVSNLEQHRVHEQRVSFIDVYRSFGVKQNAELRGLKVNPTFEDLPWFLQGFAKGGVTGVLSDTAAYTYTFTPTASTDDLKTVTWEAVSDTQDFQLPFCLGDKFDLSFQAGAAADLTLDYLAQQAIPQARTGSLSDRVTEDILGAGVQAYIDSTTIGSTAVADMVAFQFTLQNNWVQLHTFNGQVYSTKVYRKVRSASCSISVQFDTLTEYTAFMAQTERKIRLFMQGSNIVGTVAPTKKSVTIDVYGPWMTYPISDDNGVFIAKATLDSRFDAGAGWDWRIAVVNGLATLP